MRFCFLTVILTVFSSQIFAQKKPGTDLWSGSYAVYPSNEALAADTLVIRKTEDLTADKVTSRYAADLERWSLTSTRDSKKESLSVRRFLFNDDDNEYKEFGWTDLHQSGKMNCIDGGHFFICKTDPNTTVEVKGEKPFKTDTGIFGIWLHFGLVTLKKINE